jgi:hypothetical protein
MADSALFWSGNWGGAGGEHVCVCSAGVWLGSGGEGRGVEVKETYGEDGEGLCVDTDGVLVEEGEVEGPSGVCRWRLCFDDHGGLERASGLWVVDCGGERQRAARAECRRGQRRRASEAYG